MIWKIGLKTAFAAMFLLSLSACQSVWMPSGAKVLSPVVTVPLPLKAPCADPVAIPHRGLSEAEVGRLWGQDRAALGDCRDKHNALVGAVIIQERLLSGPSPKDHGL